MPAGIVEVPILDGTGAERTALFWSSNGLITGQLQPLPKLRAPADIVSLSGTITNGANAQNLIEAESNYDYVELANPTTASESLFFNDTGAACTRNPAVDTELTPGATYIWSAAGPVPVPTDAISIGADTTGHAFRAKRV